MKGPKELDNFIEKQIELAKVRFEKGEHDLCQYHRGQVMGICHTLRAFNLKKPQEITNILDRLI